VHWIALLAAWAFISLFIAVFTDESLRTPLSSLVLDAWALYICLWIRRLDSDSMAAFWCGASVVFELAWLAAASRQHPSPRLVTLIETLAIICVALWIVMIWVIRAELLKHYNRREPIGLQLRLLRSFVYSFIYFQYHLNEIARLKNRTSIGLYAGDHLRSS
jgi:hypothetical protein